MEKQKELLSTIMHKAEILEGLQAEETIYKPQ